MTDQNRQGYPERDPYRPDPYAEQGPSTYGSAPGPQPHDERYREQQLRDEYGDRYDEGRRRKGGAGKWVLLILLLIGVLVALFFWLNRDEEETADPLPEESTSQAAEEQPGQEQPSGETEAIGDAIMPVVVHEWKLNTLVVPTYMRGTDAITVVEGDSAPSGALEQLGNAMSDAQDVSFGKCGVLDFEQVDNIDFLKDLGAKPQACTLKVGETELLLVNLKGAELADLVSIAEEVDQR